MQISFRRNPKTVGWARRVVIAVLVGAIVFAATLPAAFFLFLSHNNHATPNDPQNALGALTAGMLVGLGMAAVGSAACLVVLVFFGFYRALPQE